MHQINLLSRVFFGSYSRGFILVLVLLFIRKAKRTHNRLLLNVGQALETYL